MNRFIILSLIAISARAETVMSPFGFGSCHANNWSAQANARWVPQMTAIGLSVYRTPQTGWEAIEPEEGKWRWDLLDAQMNYLESQHLQFGGIFMGSPRWNKLDRPGTFPVNNLSGWSNYVSQVVAHCKGRVKCFGQHPTYLGWLLLNDKHYAFVFQGATNTILSTWASSFTPDTIDFGQPVKIVNPLTDNITESATHTLTVAPILVDGVPDNLVQKAKDNKTKPFTWGADFTDAKAVSVTYGERNVEQGLHTKSAETVAADVIAYGGSARSGSVPGGNVFMVDPSFLSYTTVPIEIAVVVRRNEANDNAGFKLVYESTRGYKDLGWYTVPDNKEWHTVKWNITDAQFVSMWGYNFALQSDDPKFSKYCIQSVTITKLNH